MKSIRTLFSLFFIFLFSCGSETEDRQNAFTFISVDPYTDDELNVDEIASEVETVKLEVTDESLITFTTKVERTKDFIFVFDSRNQKVLQFNNSGKFIQSIGKIGDGPEEVTIATTFVLDKDKRQVYIGGRKKIVVYDFEGNFVRYFSGFNIPNFLYFKNGILEIFRTETKKLEGGDFMKFPTRYRIDASTGNTLDSLELTKVSLKSSVVSLIMDVNYYSESSKEMYFYLPVIAPEPLIRDTLYVVGDKGLEPSMKLNFGKNAISETGTKVVNIWGVFRADRYVIVRYMMERKYRLFIHDLEDDKSYNLVGGIDGEEYSDGERVLLNPMQGEANTYYFSAKKLEEGMTEEPNPTLYFVKLKN